MKKPIQVLIVDDSAVVRQVLEHILSTAPGIEVIATAADPFIAAEKIRRQVPDVIILDIEMPRMDGLTFLKKIMSQHPIPVIICSSLAEDSADEGLDALRLGAVGIITKPRIGTRQFLEEAEVLICDAVRAAAQVPVRRLRTCTTQIEPKLSADAILPETSGQSPLRTTDRVVVVGASTGGTEALRIFIEGLPPDAPGVVVVQHMPEHFTRSFADRLNQLCRVTVQEAGSGDAVIQGRVLIAPGNRHLLLRRSGARYFVDVKDGPLVSRHRPSVNVLFRSAASAAGSNAIGVIMTGMGDDGAQGMLEMHRAGAATFAQDEETCVVFGMPKEALRLGGVNKVLPLEKLAPAVLDSCRHRRVTGTGGGKKND